MSDGAVYCWGKNDVGQSDWTDQGTTVLEPRVVEGLGFEPELVAVGYGLSWLVCWGSNAYGMSSPWAPIDWPPGAQDVMPPEEPFVVTDVAMGSMHTCALLEDGRIWCWGCNAAFQLGSGPGDDACDQSGTLLGEVVIPCE